MQANFLNGFLRLNLGTCQRISYRGLHQVDELRRGQNPEWCSGMQGVERVLSELRSVPTLLLGKAFRLVTGLEQKFQKFVSKKSVAAGDLAKDK